MRIDHRGVHVVVPGKFLHSADVTSAFEEIRRKEMAQCIIVRRLFDSRHVAKRNADRIPGRRCDDLDQIAKWVREAGGRNLEGPEICEDIVPAISLFSLKPGWQQIGNLLPGKSDHCGVDQLGEQLGNG